MNRPVSALLLSLMLAACPGGESLDQPGADGRFEIRRAGEGRLHASAALATYCEADSSLTIVSLSADGAGGLAARLRWPAPPNPGDSLRLGRRLAEMGTATLAWRPLADSVGHALVADSGTASLSGTDALSGGATAWATANDSTVVRLDVRISGVPVERRCPEVPR